MKPLNCLRCGSDKIIPNVPIADRHGRMGSLSDPLEVHVHGNPDAWIFKDTSAGQLMAFICGACGHTELKTQGFQALYRKYQESLRDPEEESTGDTRSPSAPYEPMNRTLLRGQGFMIDPMRCLRLELGRTSRRLILVTSSGGAVANLVGRFGSFPWAIQRTID